MKGTTGNAAIDACDEIGFAADNVIGVADVLQCLADRMESPYEKYALNMLADELTHNADTLRKSADAIMNATRKADKASADN